MAGVLLMMIVPFSRIDMDERAACSKTDQREVQHGDDAGQRGHNLFPLSCGIVHHEWIPITVSLHWSALPVYRHLLTVATHTAATHDRTGRQILGSILLH